jgi:DNA-binding MarR family transcriptional regulator
MGVAMKTAERVGVTQPTVGEIIAGLVRAGLPTAPRAAVRAGGNSVEVVRIRITDAGRQALKAR